MSVGSVQILMFFTEKSITMIDGLARYPTVLDWTRKNRKLVEPKILKMV